MCLQRRASLEQVRQTQQFKRHSGCISTKHLFSSCLMHFYLIGLDSCSNGSSKGRYNRLIQGIGTLLKRRHKVQEGKESLPILRLTTKDEKDRKMPKTSKRGELHQKLKSGRGEEKGKRLFL
jgi:hypothetical protein